eukprot:CAMPEP_0114130950 /NCGR_PEP_ID=MMETSP0043_2-20121206/12291_1 /TAXON_ID=464988 /ORGANISM="Hemiselmis andersenii, Strain CCMP644" /LENGTH=70 /DNA_ID=CAMNT_0001224345 /DNA_START=5 /DNA_END=214 /DNA_ORIENTATION=-
MTVFDMFRLLYAAAQPAMDDLCLLHTARPSMIFAAVQPVEVVPATRSSFAPLGSGVHARLECRRHVSPAL